MAKQHLYDKNGENLPADFYREWPFVQYVLPCFGASFLGLANGNKVSEEKKKWFLHFIHRLLCSYQKTLRYPNNKFKPPLTNQEGPIFMIHKAEQIKSALSRAIFGHKKDDKIISKGFFDQFLFPLTLFCCRSKKDIIRESLKFFFYRIEDVLRKCLPPEFFLEPGSNPVKSATTLCRMVAATAFRSQGYKDGQNFEDLPSLLWAVFVNHAKANGNSCLPKMKTIRTEAKIFNKIQLLQLIFYLCYNTPHFNKNLKLQPEKHETELDLSMDVVEKAFWNYLEADAWRVKQIFSTWMRQIKSKDKEKLPDIQLNFAKSSASTSYLPVLSQIKDGKVEMAFPGEITFFPIRHCRWCGLVEAEEEFKVCKWCAEFSDYPDTCIFCSVKCEEEALEGEHIKEHDKHLVIKCGLSK